MVNSGMKTESYWRYRVRLTSSENSDCGMTEEERTMGEIQVLGICGSLRRRSTNMNLLRYAQEHAPPGMKIEIADLSAVPFYNADIAEKPAAVQTLLSQIGQADALLLACPEYNYSMAPALKNALD